MVSKLRIIWKQTVRVISACLTLQDLLFSNGTAAIYRHAIATAPGRNISANDSSFSCEEVLAVGSNSRSRVPITNRQCRWLGTAV